jgi:hypothetical protein
MVPASASLKGKEFSWAARHQENRRLAATDRHFKGAFVVWRWCEEMSCDLISDRGAIPRPCEVSVDLFHRVGAL